MGIDCVATFGLIQGNVIWQCRLDASGESFLRRADRNRPLGHITPARLREIFASADEPSLVTDAVLRELLHSSRPLPDEVLMIARRLILAWVCRLYKQMRRDPKLAASTVKSPQPRTDIGSSC